MPGDDPLPGYRQLAEWAGVRPDDLRAYRDQGRTSPPDDASVLDRPRWRLPTFQAWRRDRQGRGRGRAPRRPNDDS